MLHNLKKYDSHLVMQELDKFNLMINVIPNELEKYMSFNINNNLSFIDSFQFLCSLLELDNNVLVRDKQSYDYMSDFETFQEELKITHEDLISFKIFLLPDFVGANVPKYIFENI